MKIVIELTQAGDVKIGDVFEVVAVNGDKVTMERVYRPRQEEAPPALGVNVSDGIGMGDRVR